MDQYEGRDVLNLKNWEKFAAHRAKRSKTEKRAKTLAHMGIET
jgi:hypothetical protein